MSAVWTIAGQTGKRMDATARTLEAAGVRRPALRFASMAADSFAFQIPAVPPAGGPPEDGQTVSLYRSGVRVFTGTVTSAALSFGGGMVPVYSITVAGGWYFLEQIVLTTTQTDDAAGTAERPTVGLASGTIGVGAKAILARARSLGSPFADGVIDGGYTLPGMTFPNMSAAAALAEVLRWHPGAMTAMDYSGTGSPKLNIRLRASAATVAVDIAAQTCTPSGGSAVSCKVKAGSLTGKKNAQVGGVVLAYTDRDTTGKMVYRQQTAGSASAGSARRKVMAISGPELDTYLPRQDYETASPKTTTTVQATSTQIVAEGVLGTTWALANNYAVPAGFVKVPTLLMADGKKPTGKYFLLDSSVMPDWLVKQDGVTVEDAVWTGSLCTEQYSSRAAAEADGLATFINTATMFTYGVNAYYQYHWWKTVTLRVKVLSKAYTGSTIYRLGDYRYATPPSTLAADMYAAGNFVPYTGHLQVVEQAAMGVPWMGRAVNIATTAGMPAEFAAARAMVSAMEVSIFDGVSTVRLGPPARHDFDSLVRGIRRTPQDNIQWL